MKSKKLNAFTLIEIVMVIVVIGILTMGTTVYLGGQSDKAKLIEAQSCANTINAEIQNYIFDTLTSKQLEQISPTSYQIYITGGNYCHLEGTSNTGYCKNLIFGFYTGDNNSLDLNNNNIKIYSTINSNSNCKNLSRGISLTFSRQRDSDHLINMNKGFSTTLITDKPFKIGGLTTGSIIIGACLEGDCNNPYQIAKRDADSRSQTIALKRCKFYDSEEAQKCREREI